MLTQEHRERLLAAAIKADVLDASGIESTQGGINFPWWDGNGTRLTQFRPDEPIIKDNGEEIKYLFPRGSKMILNQLRDPGYGPVLICEGTKQQYAALSWAPANFAVYGLAGCWCWTDADLMPFMGREVYIVFDGDFVSNRDVYDAAAKFKETLEQFSAQSVRFVKIPGTGKDGLDDVLARIPEAKRGELLSLWITQARDKLPKAPAKKDKNPFFERGSLKVQAATEFLLERQPAALTQERKIAVYLKGSYHIDGSAYNAAVTRMLGDEYRPNWRAAMEDMAEGILFESAKILPDRNAHQMMNCTNGMLDLRTLELVEHDPKYMSCVQIPVAWDPEAKAPTYEAWLEESCGTQGDDLEEVASTMLDPTRTPSKAAFLFGPSRSGKSTFLRIMQAMAGVENRTAVTLHELSTSQFAAANIYGKILNSAADLSSAHVADLSTFKMMTGEDPIQGNRKYGNQFTFTNSALFAFSANELPTVSESSRAYSERIKPFEFPNSFAGRENPAIEATMLGEELPGILVRWVHAYRRILARGGYSVTDERVRSEFDTRSDRVAQWVAECCVITAHTEGAIVPATECTGRRETAQEFNRWAERNGGHKMGERKVFERLRQISGIYEVRVAVTKARAFNIVVRDTDAADLEFSPDQDPKVAEVAETNPFSPYVMNEKTDTQTHGENGFETATSATVILDLETCGVSDLHKRENFVRLAGWQKLGGTSATGSPVALMGALESATTLSGHNILGFDLLALAKWHGADYEALAAKSVDTLIVERHLNPVAAKGVQPRGYYGLDATAARYGAPEKTDDIRRLSRKYGGFHAIPLDDPEYNAYLRGDLAASQGLYEALAAHKNDPYIQREHQVQTIMGRIQLEGFRVDEELVWDRYQRGYDRLELMRDRMINEFGMPEFNEKGKPLALPHRGKGGPEAFKRALVSAGIPEGWIDARWERGRKGDLLLGKDVLEEKIKFFRQHGKEDAATFCEVIQEMNGVRSVYGTVIDWMVGGRVHPSIQPLQASGRWSVQDPGLTVMGKRGGKYVEREIFLPEKGHVLVAFDLDQVDMRAVAGMAQDAKYMELFAPGRDVHSEVAKMVGLPREEAKAIGHGWNYGEGINKMVASGVRREAAEQFDAQMRENFPVLCEYREVLREQAGALPFGEKAPTGDEYRILHNGYGRPMRVERERAYTQAPALIGQGTTRDIMAEGLLRMPFEVRKLIKAVVHDEIVVSIPAGSVQEVSSVILNALTFEFRGVPITSGASKPGSNWAQCYEK